MGEVIKNTGITLFSFVFLMDDGTTKEAPVGVGYLPNKGKIFFYPADAGFMKKNGVTNLDDFLRDWLIYTKVLSNQQINTSEIEACNRANAYYTDFLEQYFDNKKFKLLKGEPFSKEWSNFAWQEMKKSQNHYNYLKNLFNFDSNNVSTL